MGIMSVETGMKVSPYIADVEEEKKLVKNVGQNDGQEDGIQDVDKQDSVEHNM